MKKTAFGFTLLAALILSAGCSVANASSSAATDVCVARQAEVALSWGSVRSVAGGFAVTARELADWQETRDAARGIQLRSKWRAMPIELPVTVCYYDGNFNNFPGRAKRPPYDRIAVIVGADGKLTLDAAGPHDNLKVERPTRK